MQTLKKQSSPIVYEQSLSLELSGIDSEIAMNNYEISIEYDYGVEYVEWSISEFLEE